MTRQASKTTRGFFRFFTILTTSLGEMMLNAAFGSVFTLAVDEVVNAVSLVEIKTDEGVRLCCDQVALC